MINSIWCPPNWKHFHLPAPIYWACANHCVRIDRHTTIQWIWWPTRKFPVESLFSAERMGGILHPTSRVTKCPPPFKMLRKGSDQSPFSFRWCVQLPEVLAISQIQLSIWPHLLRIGVLMTYFSLILNFLFRPKSKESRGFLLLALSHSSAVHFHVKVAEKPWDILQEGRPAGVPSMDLKCSVICS